MRERFNPVGDSYNRNPTLSLQLIQPHESVELLESFTFLAYYNLLA